MKRIANLYDEEEADVYNSMYDDDNLEAYEDEDSFTAGFMKGYYGKF